MSLACLVVGGSLVGFWFCYWFGSGFVWLFGWLVEWMSGRFFACWAVGVCGGCGVGGMGWGGVGDICIDCQTL